MRRTRALLAVPGLVLALAALSGCDVSDVIGQCEITVDTFASSYGPSETKSHAFEVGCAGTITVSWACPQCPDPDTGRLTLLDPVGSPVFEILGAGFGGEQRSVTTLLEGRWTILIQGTGGALSNYSVDVTYPGI